MGAGHHRGIDLSSAERRQEHLSRQDQRQRLITREQIHRVAGHHHREDQTSCAAHVDEHAVHEGFENAGPVAVQIPVKSLTPYGIYMKSLEIESLHAARVLTKFSVSGNVTYRRELDGIIHPVNLWDNDIDANTIFFEGDELNGWKEWYDYSGMAEAMEIEFMAYTQNGDEPDVKTNRFVTENRYAWQMLERMKVSPVPAQMVSGLAGSTAMAPTVVVPAWSKMGVQERPSFVDFQSPPEAPPT